MNLRHFLLLALSSLIFCQASTRAQGIDDVETPDVAAKATYKKDETIQQVLSKPGAKAETAGNSRRVNQEKAKVGESFGDLRIEIQSLQVVEGNKYLLTMRLTNQSTNNSIWMAFNGDTEGHGVKGHINDARGFECRIDSHGLSGIEAATQFLSYGKGTGYATIQELQNPHHRFTPAREIKPNDATTATVKFVSSSAKQLESGPCTLQIEFLVGHDFDSGGGTVAVANLVTKIESE
jgi:hypothetical protein